MSGFLLHGSTLTLGRHYDIALTMEAILIFLALYLLSQGYFYGHYAASAACGLQNALATTYSGATIRTTHLTGLFTDLGIMLGAKFRGEAFDKRRAVLYLLIVFGFVSGGTWGTYIFTVLGFKVLAVPGLICVILAVVYRFYSAKVQRQ